MQKGGAQVKHYLTKLRRQVSEFEAAKMVWRDDYEHTEQNLESLTRSRYCRTKAEWRYQ